MRLTMKIQIVGVRDGVEWPAPGGVIDVPDHEAESLIGCGYAEEATDAPTPDPAPPAVVEASEDPAEDSDGAVQAEPVRPVAKRARRAKG